jgi:hypothetical protein
VKELFNNRLLIKKIFIILIKQFIKSIYANNKKYKNIFRIFILQFALIIFQCINQTNLDISDG